MAESVVTRIASVFLIALLLQARTIAQTPAPLVVGIDHIPVVVANLEKAQADFRRMGFSIKPGRPHADGIRNAHVKFSDGTEIELITAPAAVDELTTEYRAKIKNGDGPVYFGLYAPNRTAVAAKLRIGGFAVEDEDNSILAFPSGSPLHPLFFGGRNKSPTDKPEYFAHANSAVRLSALWARDDQELRKLFRALGMPFTPVHQCAPIGKSLSSAALPEGNVYLVPSVSANVVVARVEVRSLATLESVLKKNEVAIAKGMECDPDAIWISPKIAHGIWLEFVGPH